MGDELFAEVERLAPVIRAAGDQIEQDRRLPAELVEALREAGFFRMPMPAAWGGPEVDPFVQFDVIEALSRINPSVGWVVMIGSDGGYYSANLPQDAARKLWPDLDMITAGWLSPGGVANAVEGGFRVSGRWSFGSASLHADVMVAGVLVFDNGVPRPGDAASGIEGMPEFRVVCMPASDVTVIDTWHTTGLKGSGSNDYAIEDLFVPEDHTWVWLAPAKRPGPLYAFPYMFFGNIAAVPLGAARAAIDELVRLAQSKVLMPEGTLMGDAARVQSALAQCETLVGSARAWALDVLREIWAIVCRGETVGPELTARFRLSVMHAFQAAKEAIALAYDTAGTSAVYSLNPLDGLLRDAQTMAQHMLGSTKTLEPAGRLLLGLPANAPGF